MRTVTIEIDQTTGDMTVDMAGFVGSSCEAVERLITDCAGEPDTKERKDSYYIRTTNQQRVGGR